MIRPERTTPGENPVRTPAAAAEPVIASASADAVASPATSSLHHKSGRRSWSMFEMLCFGSTWISVGILMILLWAIARMSTGWLDWEFLTSYDSRFPGRAGLLAGIWGSFWLILFTALFAIPLGVGAALYLEEYSEDSWLRRLIQVNLSNLAGVPSIVYGILGLTVFVRMFSLFSAAQTKYLVISLGLGKISIPFPLGRTAMAGSLTLTLMILPVVIVATQESLRAIPSTLRHASLALGATRWQTVRHQVLPAAIPGIMTGVILALSRALGETAPLVMIGALSYVRFTPGGIESFSDMVTNPQGLLDAPFESFTAMPIQIYNWVSRPKAEYQHVAAAGIGVLLMFLLVLNSAAVYIRNKYGRIRW